MTKSTQLPLKLKQWGGKRRGAGRKPTGPRSGVSHRPRPIVKAAHPVHVTLRVEQDVANLRVNAVFAAVRRALQAGSKKDDFGIVHFSVMRNHIHLIAEAEDNAALSRGLQGLCVRLAKAINKRTNRRGRVFSDRFHAVVLKTPTQVKSALAYVLSNARKHAAEAGRKLSAAFVDPCSSARHFDGWRERRAEPTPFAAAKSWVLRIGWRRRGLLSIAAVPG